MVAAKVEPASRLVLGKRIKAQFGAGKWHSFETIRGECAIAGGRNQATRRRRR